MTTLAGAVLLVCSFVAWSCGQSACWLEEQIAEYAAAALLAAVGVTLLLRALA